MIKRFFELQEKILAYHKDTNLELLKKAYSVAADAHFNQRRATNEPYIIHPLEVAGILADMKLDDISIAAGLLHDIVEDTSYSIEDIARLFGNEIADIIQGVTKISKIPEFDVEQAKAETLKKMIIAMTNDVRVILIKLADRLHNMKTLDPLREDKRKRIARETLEIYAPIAYRLGMGKMKIELEDIAFQYAYSDEYREISEKLEGKEEWIQDQLEHLQGEIGKILKNLKIPGEIYYRRKREISIHRKLERQNIELDKVYDLMGLRIITKTVENCYVIMGEIHRNWTHIPSRWRDFISSPKSNGYQSIHTTIIKSEGIKFEIQIRTQEMHKIAEEGIAAHWKYKEGITFLENDQRLQWFRDLIENYKSNPNPREFLKLVKGDLVPTEIYVFTPKGKVITLSAKSTPIDFAYAIHTEIGNHCRGAIVNENHKPLKTELSSGDVVEIITSKDVSPSADWLKYVATDKARKKIMGIIQKKENQLNVERGKRLWTKSFREFKRRHRLAINEDEFISRIQKLNYPDTETFFRDIGSNKRSLDRLTLKAIFPEISLSEIKPIQRPGKKISRLYKLINVEGYQDIDVSLGRCCNPIKGDHIVGYITKHRGLVIHKKDCVNMKNILPERKKMVTWNENESYGYVVSYEIIVQNRPGVLSAVTGITGNFNSNIKNIELEKISQNMAKLKLIFEVYDVEQLNNIYNGFRKTKGVFSIFKRRLADK